jgi:hypothetical protein
MLDNDTASLVPLIGLNPQALQQNRELFPASELYKHVGMCVRIHGVMFLRVECYKNIRLLT